MPETRDIRQFGRRTPVIKDCFWFLLWHEPFYYWVDQKIHLGFSALCYENVNKLFGECNTLWITVWYSIGGLPWCQSGKNLPANAGDARDAGSTPQLRRFPIVGIGNSLQYSFLENPMDGGTWRVRVQGLQIIGHDSVNEHAHIVCVCHSPIIRETTWEHHR